MRKNQQRTFVITLTLGVLLGATASVNAQPLRRSSLETPRQQLEDLSGFGDGLNVQSFPELKGSTQTVLKSGSVTILRKGIPIGQLTVAKRDDDDEDLEREQRRRPNPEEARHHIELREQMERFEHRKREILEALESTRNEDERQELEKALHNMEREQSELREHLQHRERQGRREGQEDAERREQMERVHALHEAAERLAHSGLGEMAEELHHRAEQLEREIHRAGEREADPEAVLRRLMENMEQLRGEVRELHHKLDRVLERLEEHSDDDDEFSLNAPLPHLETPQPEWWDDSSVEAVQKHQAEQPFHFDYITVTR